MNHRTRDYFIIIGKTSLFMIAAIIAAALGFYLQLLKKQYVTDYYGSIFSGGVYRYHILFYLAGAAFYIGVFSFLYRKWMRRVMKQLAAYSVGFSILIWVICLFWGIVMFLIQFIVEFLNRSHMTDLIEPEVLTWISAAGWPMLTLLFLGCVIGKNRNMIEKNSNVI